MSEFKNRVHAAKYVPSQAFTDGVSNTLVHLHQQPAKPKPRFLVPAIVTAALCVVVFAGPSIVKAAAPYFKMFFSGLAGAIRQEQQKPQQERIESIAASWEDTYRRQVVEEKTTVGDYHVSLPELTVHKDPNNGTGMIDLQLEFTPPEGLDPAMTDFTLDVDGNTARMYLDAAKQYRENQERYDDGAGWGNVYIRDGKMLVNLRFPFEQFNAQMPVKMVLKGVLYTYDARGNQTGLAGELNLPFTYDPALAHSQMLESVKESLPAIEKYEQSNLRLYDALSLKSTPLNSSKTMGAQTVFLGETAYDSGTMYFLVGTTNNAEKSAKLDAMDYSFGLRIDGIYASNNSQWEDLGYKDTEAGKTLQMVYQTRPSLDLSRLKGESLIYFQVENFRMNSQADFVFKYDWGTNAVTLPKDDAQEKEWLELEAKMNKEKNIPDGQSMMFLPEIPCTVDGVTMTLREISFGRVIVLGFSCDKPIPENQALPPLKLLINGVLADELIASGQSTYNYAMSLPYGELPEDFPVEIELPLTIYDKNRNPVFTGTFRFETILSKSKAIVVGKSANKKEIN